MPPPKVNLSFPCLLPGGHGAHLLENWHWQRSWYGTERLACSSRTLLVLVTLRVVSTLKSDFHAVSQLPGGR